VTVPKKHSVGAFGSASHAFWSVHHRTMAISRVVIGSFSRVDQSEDGSIPEEDGGHRRLLPWGSAPFGGSSSGDRVAALPRLRHPPTGFLTLPAVFSHPGLVALFHATSTHRILVFRAFPSSSAAISLDIRCSPVVSPAIQFHRRTGFPFGPCHPSFVSPTMNGEQPRAPSTHLCIAPDIIFTRSRLASKPMKASGPCGPEG